MRRPYGLRPRLLAALVLTAAVTLLAAALTLLGPLRERLREESARSLQAAVVSARPGIEQGMPRRGRGADYRAAFGLARRTGARIVLYDAVPREQFDTGTGAMTTPPSVYSTLNDVRTTRAIGDGDVRVTAPLRERAGGPLIGVLVAVKPQTDVG
ncbi:MAG TPA: hypothetical protein VF587_13740, partial [Solirubrobacteraceae bacterium]